MSKSDTADESVVVLLSIIGSIAFTSSSSVSKFKVFLPPITFANIPLLNGGTL